MKVNAQQFVSINWGEIAENGTVFKNFVKST